MARTPAISTALRTARLIDARPTVGIMTRSSDNKSLQLKYPGPASDAEPRSVGQQLLELGGGPAPGYSVTEQGTRTCTSATLYRDAMRGRQARFARAANVRLVRRSQQVGQRTSAAGPCRPPCGGDRHGLGPWRSSSDSCANSRGVPEATNRWRRASDPA